jgi:NAD(P)-dependent dehydrogenase (short-subunit alcohol dehydrogenase family)
MHSLIKDKVAQMDLGLKGKVVLISGGASGLGLETARVFAEEGAILSICSRNREALDAAAATIKALGVQCLTFIGDLTRADVIDRWVAETQQTFGRIDVLINNASATRGGGFADVSADDLSSALELKLFGYLNLTRAVVPIMKAQRSGSIVNIVGVTAAQPVAGAFPGALAGGALLGFSKLLANELAGHGIRVNAVSPGMTATHRHAAMLDTMMRSGMSRIEAEQASVREIPLGRPAEAREVASAIAFVASERASYILGVNLDVDGGFTRGV